MKRISDSSTVEAVVAVSSIDSFNTVPGGKDIVGTKKKMKRNMCKG